MKLYSGPLSMFGMKAGIALLEKGLDFDLEMVPFDADDRYRPAHPEVERVNPKGQVPVLVHGGLELFDSTQIFEYLEDAFPEPTLWPRDVRRRAVARQLELLADEVYFPVVVRLMFLQDRLDGPEARAAIGEAGAFYRRMEAQLGDQDYLAGDYSYADIALFMAALFGERMGAVLTGDTPALLRWRERCARRPAVRGGIAPLKAHLLAAGRPVPDFVL